MSDFTIGKQSCQHYNPARGSHGFDSDVHECFGPFDGRPRGCFGKVSFCTTCHSDHHSNGYETCGRTPMPQHEKEAEAVSDPIHVDNVVPGGEWVFNQDVTDAFDDMLQRSIPQYEVMRRAVTDIARAFLLNQGNYCGVIDLGCSRGGAIAALVDEFPQVEFGGIDASAPMVVAARARFIDNHNVTIAEGDVRTHALCNLLPSVPAAVVIAVLSLQFIPIADRLTVLAQAEADMISGGCLIMVEKIIGRTPRNERLFTHLYYDNKRRNGYSDEAIRVKATSLDGVLEPITEDENKALIRDSGFIAVECFWRWMNFAGWVAVKP